jgi:hypothetical protein
MTYKQVKEFIQAYNEAKNNDKPLSSELSIVFSLPDIDTKPPRSKYTRYNESETDLVYAIDWYIIEWIQNEDIDTCIDFLNKFFYKYPVIFKIFLVMGKHMSENFARKFFQGVKAEHMTSYIVDNAFILGDMRVYPIAYCTMNILDSYIERCRQLNVDLIPHSSGIWVLFGFGYNPDNYKMFCDNEEGQHEYILSIIDVPKMIIEEIKNGKDRERILKLLQFDDSNEENVNRFRCGCLPFIDRNTLEEIRNAV